MKYLIKKSSRKIMNKYKVMKKEIRITKDGEKIIEVFYSSSPSSREIKNKAKTRIAIYMIVIFVSLVIVSYILAYRISEY